MRLDYGIMIEIGDFTMVKDYATETDVFTTPDALYAPGTEVRWTDPYQLDGPLSWEGCKGIDLQGQRLCMGFSQADLDVLLRTRIV